MPWRDRWQAFLGRPQETFLTLLLWVGVGLLVLFAREGIRERRESRESREWPSTPGEIFCSRVHYSMRTTGGRSSTRRTCYRADIRYRYAVAQRLLQGWRVTLAGVPSSSGFAGDCTWGTVRALLARYPEGRSVAVWYRPDDPAVSVLERDSWDGESTPDYLLVAAGLLAVFALKKTVDLFALAKPIDLLPPPA